MSGGTGPALISSPAAPPHSSESQHKDDDPLELSFKYDIRLPLAGWKNGDGAQINWPGAQQLFKGGKVKLKWNISLVMAVKAQWQLGDSVKKFRDKYHIPSKYGVSVKAADVTESGFCSDFTKKLMSHATVATSWYDYLQVEGCIKPAFMAGGMFTDWVADHLSAKAAKDAQDKIAKDGAYFFRLEAGIKVTFFLKKFIADNFPSLQWKSDWDKNGTFVLEGVLRLISLNKKDPLYEDPQGSLLGLSPPKAQLQGRLNFELDWSPKNDPNIPSDLRDAFPDKAALMFMGGMTVETDITGMIFDKMKDVILKKLAEYGLERYSLTTFMRTLGQRAASAAADAAETVVGVAEDALAMVTVDAVITIAIAVVASIVITILVLHLIFGDLDEATNIAHNFDMFCDGFFVSMEHAIRFNGTPELDDTSTWTSVAGTLGLSAGANDRSYYDKGRTQGADYGNKFYAQLKQKVQANWQTADQQDAAVDALNHALKPGGGVLYDSIVGSHHAQITGNIRHDFYKAYWLSHTSKWSTGVPGSNFFSDAGWLIRDTAFRNLYQGLINENDYTLTGVLSKDIEPMAVGDAWYRHCDPENLITDGAGMPFQNREETAGVASLATRSNGAIAAAGGMMPDPKDYANWLSSLHSSHTLHPRLPPIPSYLLAQLTADDYEHVGNVSIPWPKAYKPILVVNKRGQTLVNPWYHANGLPQPWPCKAPNGSWWWGSGKMNWDDKPQP